MKSLLSVSLLVLFLVVCSGYSHAIVLYPMSDVPTYSNTPSANFNNYGAALDAELWTGNFSDGSAGRSYLKFNLSGLPFPHSVILKLYNGVNSGAISSFAPADVSVYGTAAVWGEGTMTWNNQPALGGLGGTTTVNNATGWYSWDVTSLAQSATGNILSLGLSSDGAGHVYYARETASEFMPYLDVNVMPEPATLLIFGAFMPVILFFRKK